MPYKDMRQVNPAIRGIKPAVNLQQANMIASWADSMQQDQKTSDGAWPMAIAAFKKAYVKQGRKWVKRAEAQKEANVMPTIMKTVAGSKYPASDFLVVEDPESPSTWHLQISKNGTLDHRLMGAAAAALTVGYRGNKYEGPNKAAALSKLKKLYSDEKMDFPSEAELQQVADLAEMYGMDSGGGMHYVPSNVYTFAQLDAVEAAQEAVEDLSELTQQYICILQNIVYDGMSSGGDKLAAFQTLTDEFQARLADALAADSSGGGMQQQQEESEAESAEPVSLQVSESQPAHAALEEDALQEAAAQNSLLFMDVQVIRPGWGNSQDNNYYSRALLEAAAPKFVGAKMFETDHKQEEKNTRTWVSTVTEMRGFTDDGAPIARVAVHDPSFAERVRNLKEANLLDKMECSILAMGKARPGFTLEGRTGKAVEDISEVLSVDWVTKAGAGGKALGIAESADGSAAAAAQQDDSAQNEEDTAEQQTEQTEQQEEETQAAESVNAVIHEEGTAQQQLEIKEVNTALSKVNLPDAAKKRLQALTYADKQALETAISAEVEYVKELTGSGRVFANGESARQQPVSLEEINRRKDAVNQKHLRP